MDSKYFNDAIIGNKNLRATFSSKGEMLRLYYPEVDFKQFIDSFNTGVKINDSSTIYLNNDINNKYKQYYISKTNILNTEISNSYFKLDIIQTDFVLIKQNILIKRYKFKNLNKMNLDVRFLIRSKLLTNDNNMMSGKIIKNGLIQYGHDYSLSIFADKEINGHRINDVEEYFRDGSLQDKDYIGMSSDSAISYDIGCLKPNEEAYLNVYLYVGENDKYKNMSDLEKKITELKEIEAEKEESTVKKYWEKYIEKHDTLKLENNEKEVNARMINIYTRTILLFALLQNEETGGIAASVEIDESRQKSGRYAYCWPRDAVFIARAFDILGMNKETEKFYKVFCKNTQSQDGMWEQRFYTDGRLAPSWGYQIDETASVIYGIYEHYQNIKDERFLSDNLKMCEKAVEFLLKYLANLFEEKEDDVVKEEIEEYSKKTGKETDKIYKHLSYDLWEMNEGVHLYSLSSIYAALESMINIYGILKPKYIENRLKIEQITKRIVKYKEEQAKIKKYIIANMSDENSKILYRNTKDKMADISVLGGIVPFNVFTPKEKKILNTIEKINMTLRTYTGGYLRFEQDTYMQGTNPWPIATLWMALYNLQAGEKAKAKECLNFVIKSSTDLGFLAEQVDNKTMKSNWVIGLGWAHAMYIIALSEILKK